MSEQHTNLVDRVQARHRHPLVVTAVGARCLALRYREILLFWNVHGCAGVTVALFQYHTGHCGVAIIRAEALCCVWLDVLRKASGQKGVECPIHLYGQVSCKSAALGKENAPVRVERRGALTA